MNTLSQKDQIHEALKSGELLTGLDALDRFGCNRLPARILEIEETGQPVARRMIKTNTGKHVKQYYIVKQGYAV